MFQIKENECVGFDSKWRVKKVSTVNSTQTTEYELKEIETQSATKAEVETQTEVSQLPDVEMEKVAVWLKSIYPKVEKELNDTHNTNSIFKDYQPIFDNVLAEAKLLQQFKVFGQPTNSGDDEALRVSAMSINCTGNSLAVSCNFIHKNWCHHSGNVKFYNFTKDDLLTEKVSKKISTDSCVTYLQYHPNFQFVLVGGLYSGDIIIWNTENTSGNGVLCKVNAHSDGLTQISWIHDVDTTKTLLLGTSSLDGFLNIWNFSFAKSSLTPKEKYKIKPPLLGRINQIELNTPVSNKVNRGIIGFDFSPYVPQTFVVGIEGGLIVECSTLGCKNLAGSKPNLPISDPVYKYYEPLEGEIQTIKFSPNRREMFLTLGTLGEIRIYVLGQEEPAQVIFLEKPLMIAGWIPFEEKLICGCGEKGILEIFDVLKARPLKDIGKFDLKRCLMTQMVLSSKRPTMVITGNELGIIHLWNVPWRQFSLNL